MNKNLYKNDPTNKNVRRIENYLGTLNNVYLIVAIIDETIFNQMPYIFIPF